MSLNHLSRRTTNQTVLSNNNNSMCLIWSVTQQIPHSTTLLRDRWPNMHGQCTWTHSEIYGHMNITAICDCTHVIPQHMCACSFYMQDHSWGYVLCHNLKRLVFLIFWGAFETFLKMTGSLVTSVRPLVCVSVCMEQLGCHRTVIIIVIIIIMFLKG